MDSTATLTGSHLRTYQCLYEDPVSSRVAWGDVHSLLRRLGAVQVEPNGNLTVARNGQTLILRPPGTHDAVEATDLLALRQFLARSERPGKTNGRAARWLVVIARHEARIYRSAAPRAVAQLIRPAVSEESFCQAYSSPNVPYGHRLTEPSRLYEPVAGVLNGAGQILVFGGTGSSTEMDQFTSWLRQHRPELAKRIVGSLVVDEDALSEDELLAKARGFYAQVGTDESGPR